MSRLVTFFPALAGALLFAPAGGWAHPHVWITGAATLHFAETQLDRIGMRWQFDAFFSQVLIGDFDKDKDGAFNAAETDAMQQQVFTSLKEYGYFTHLLKDDAAVEIERVENFTTAVDSGELVFVFDLVLAAPVDLAASPVQMSLFDPTIYVDIILGGDKPVVIDGVAEDRCGWTFAAGEEISGMDGGYLTPQTVTISCKS